VIKTGMIFITWCIT